MDTADDDALYQSVGGRIRQAREHQPERLSQAAMAKKLGVSRASVVNIEAGRQRAPLYLLWKVAQHLDVELATLIPSKAEFTAPPANVKLGDSMREQLKQVTNGDAALEKALSSFIAQAVSQLSSPAKQAPRIKRKKAS